MCFELNLLVFFLRIFISIFIRDIGLAVIFFLQYICQIFYIREMSAHKMILEVFFLQFSRTVWGLVLILFKTFSRIPQWSHLVLGPFFVGMFCSCCFVFYGGMFYYLFNLFASYRFVQIFISFWFSSVSCMFLEI